MNKFKFYFILLITTVSLFSCSKNDTEEITPPRAYADQYATDIKDIEEYLNTYYLNMDLTDPNFADKDVVMTKIPVGGTQPSIMSYKDATTYPKLLSREVSLHSIKYILYYLVLREGVGESPCNVDSVLASYRGDYLQRSVATGSDSSVTATQFEEVKYPQSFFDLSSTITGWGETFPKFKTGTYTSNPDGTITYNDFGAGVMFIPSGLAYYNSGSGSIPSYSPLIFSFKLYEISRLDQDKDGIPSYQEDNGDGYVYYLATGVENIDDTDKDGIPDFLDVDDDGDKYTTKLEITNAATGLVYPFALIPDCSGNTTDPARVKKHLDKTCH
jgi:hypothetical protein